MSATRLAADGLIPSLTAKQKRLPLREAIAKALEKRMADEQVKKKVRYLKPVSPGLAVTVC